EGKARSSRNAISHGLYCADQAAFNPKESDILAAIAEIALRYSLKSDEELAFARALATAELRLKIISVLHRSVFAHFASNSCSSEANAYLSLLLHLHRHESQSRRALEFLSLSLRRAGH